MLGSLDDWDLDLDNCFAVNIQHPEEQPDENKPALLVVVPLQAIVTNVNEDTVNNDKKLIVNDRCDVLAFIKSKEIFNTKCAEKRDVNKVSTWLAAVKGETRALHLIPPAELNDYLSQYFINCVRNDGKQHQPSSESAEFHVTRKALKAKFPDLFSEELGRKPNASKPVTDEEGEKLWKTGQLGMLNPKKANFLQVVYPD